MRGTRAKALRREAEGLTEGAADRAYVKPKFYTVGVPDGVDMFGAPKQRPFTYTGEIALAPGCTRSVYKNLKREYKGQRR